MKWEYLESEAVREAGEAMAPRVLKTIDPLEKELCVDVARDDRDRLTANLIVFSMILLDRAVMGLATIGVPWDVVAARAERSFKEAAEAMRMAANRRGQS